jgi:hypothetical protein
MSGISRRNRGDRGRVPARAIAFFASYGTTVQRGMTDKGSAYRSTVHALPCQMLDFKHFAPGHTRRARTQGERFI